MNKVMELDGITNQIFNGDKIMIGGFGNRGYPRKIIKKMLEMPLKDLSFIVNALNQKTRPELEELVKQKGIHLTCTFIRMSNVAFNLFNEGKVRMLPQGTFAESIRMAGMGIPAYYNIVGIGTDLAKGKEIRTFNGKDYLLEEAIYGDVAIIRVNIADKIGNCFIKGSSKSFSPLMALASDKVFIEAEEIVEIGEIDPELITIPSILVTGLIKVKEGE